MTTLISLALNSLSFQKVNVLAKGCTVFSSILQERKFQLQAKRIQIMGQRVRSMASCCGAVLRHIRQELLLVLIISGVVVGFLIGALINEHVNAIADPEMKATAIMLIGFPGELFMNMLKLLILPLIVASLITALATLDSKATGKIGRRTVLYYLGTMLIAVLIGIALVVAIRPGERSKTDRTGEEKVGRPYRGLDSLLDLLR